MVQRYMAALSIFVFSMVTPSGEAALIKEWWPETDFGEQDAPHANSKQDAHSKNSRSMIHDKATFIGDCGHAASSSEHEVGILQRTAQEPMAKNRTQTALSVGVEG